MTGEARSAAAPDHRLSPAHPLPIPTDGLLLAIDTALHRAVVALGRADGSVIDSETWLAGHRHGEELLPRVAAVLARNRAAVGDLAGIITGTGPGAFTGLRVGIATAKALAHGLGLPIVGISSAAALLDAAGRDAAAVARADPGGPGATADRRAAPLTLLLPAGPTDRMLVVDGEARLLPAGEEPAPQLAEGLVAVDLAGRAPASAIARGDHATGGLGAALLRLGGDRLARGDVDDLARLVPQYVTLPRGVLRERGEVAWSRGPR